MEAAGGWERIQRNVRGEEVLVRLLGTRCPDREEELGARARGKEAERAGAEVHCSCTNSGNVSNSAHAQVASEQCDPRSPSIFLASRCSVSAPWLRSLCSRASTDTRCR